MWVEFLAEILVNHCGVTRSTSAPQLFAAVGPSGPKLVIEVHMDDLHSAGEDIALQRLGDTLKKHVTVKEWKIFVVGEAGTYSHLRRIRTLAERHSASSSRTQHTYFVAQSC